MWLWDGGLSRCLWVWGLGGGVCGWMWVLLTLFGVRSGVPCFAVVMLGMGLGGYVGVDGKEKGERI